MPYIKYFGGLIPPTVRDLVLYEDPASACFEGHLASLNSTQSRCEKEGVSRDRWGEQFFSDLMGAPYPGLRHVGGVGHIEENALRLWDQVITQEEYESIKAQILATNAAYREAKDSDLALNNDPLRRPESEDEQRGWRTRVWINSYTELMHHVPYRVNESCRAYLRVREYAPDGSTLQLFDLYHPASSGISSALFEGLELADRLTDMLALAGFGRGAVVQVLGTSRPTCRENKEFEVAILQARIMNTPVVVEPENFEFVSTLGAMPQALRHVREGLNADRSPTAFASFWNALEQVAEDEARANDWKRVVRCPKCRDERNAGWDTKRSFEPMYRHAGVEPKFDRHRSLRGRVQHGATLFSNLEPAAFLSDVVQVQSVAVAAVGKRIGLLPRTGTYLRTTEGVTIMNCVVQGGSFTIAIGSVEIGVSPSLLPMRASSNARRAVQAGVLLPPQLDPLAIPPVVE